MSVETLKKPNLNPSQKHSDNQFAVPGKPKDDVAKGLQQLENYANDSTANGSTEKSNTPTTSAADAKEQESKPRSGWRNRFKGPAAALEGRGSGGNKGPIGVIISLVFGGSLFGLVGIPGVTGGPFDVFFNDRNDIHSSSYRKNFSAFANKLGGDPKEKAAKTGFRGRAATVSDTMAKRLEHSGFTIIGKTYSADGKRVAMSGLAYTIVNKDPTKTRTVAANNKHEFKAFYRHLSVASAFHRTHSFSTSLFVTGSFFKKSLAKDNLTKEDKVKGSTAEEAEKSYEASVKGERGTVSSSVTPATGGESQESKDKAAASNDSANELSQGLDKAIADGTKISKISVSATNPANPLAAPQLACATYNTISAANTIRETKIKAYLARFAMIYLTWWSKLKAGLVTVAENSVIFNRLFPSKFPTMVEDPETGKMIKNPNIGKNFTDSTGYRSIRGDNVTISGLATKFFVSGGPLGSLQKIVNWLNTTIGRDKIKFGCNLVNNQVVTIITMLAAPLVSIAAAAVSQVIQLDEWAALLANYIMETLAGSDPTGGYVGVDAGDGIFVGLGVIMGTASSSFGMPPATSTAAVKENIAANQEVINQEIAIARYDAASTPLDITNQYSFLGSIAAKVASFMPDLSQPLAVSASKVASIIPASFGSLTTNSYASYSMPPAPYHDHRFDQCPSEDRRSVGIVSDLWCGDRFAPFEHMEEDAAIAAMEGQFNEDDGTPLPGSHLEKYVKHCGEGRTDPLGKTGVALEEQTDDLDWYTAKRCPDESNHAASEFIGYVVTEEVLNGEPADTPKSAPKSTSGSNLAGAFWDGSGTAESPATKPTIAQLFQNGLGRLFGSTQP